MRSETMNAARSEPNTSPKPTHTFWPTGRRPGPASAKPTEPATEKKEDEHATEEPGYGFGV
jgi:hypothetical protein